jgi:cell division protease FtsH
LKNTICILFGGRIAEKIIFDEITTGAGNDIERASALARKMVCEWGMSDELGALTYGKKEEQIFLGREISQNRDFSEDTARLIDGAVRKLVDEAMETVTKLLKDHRDILTLMAEELLEKETIVLTDIERMVEELRPGLYTSRIRIAKAKKKVSPKPVEPVDESVDESIEEVLVEERSETVVDEHPKDDTESKVTDDEVAADSDDIQDQQTQKP